MCRSTCWLIVDPFSPIIVWKYQIETLKIYKAQLLASMVNITDGDYKLTIWFLSCVQCLMCLLDVMTCLRLIATPLMHVWNFAQHGSFQHKHSYHFVQYLECLLRWPCVLLKSVDFCCFLQAHPAGAVSTRTHIRPGQPIFSCSSKFSRTDFCTFIKFFHTAISLGKLVQTYSVIFADTSHHLIIMCLNCSKRKLCGGQYIFSMGRLIGHLASQSSHQSLVHLQEQFCLEGREITDYRVENLSVTITINNLLKPLHTKYCSHPNVLSPVIL